MRVVKNLKSNARKAKRAKSTAKQIEVYNKIQTRYENMFNMCMTQPIEVLNKMKNEKMSATDRAAFDKAYEIISKRTKIN